MTERAFPFALLGMVHIANRIEQRRAIPLTARPTIRVCAENLRPHRRGRQLDMVTEAELDGEVVWLEHSQLPEARHGRRRRPPRRQPARERIGRARSPRAPSGRSPATSAAATRGLGRSQPDPPAPDLSARLFGFPGAIAHGMWTLARALAAFEGRYPDAHTSEVAFQAPLRIPGRPACRDRRGEAWDFSLESPDGEHRHLELVR